MSWLSPARWLLMGGLVLAVVLGYFDWRAHEREIGRQEVRAEYTELALKASEQARAKEAELSKKVEGVANAYQTEKKKRAADAAAAADALGLLKSALGAANERENTATAGRPDDPRDRIISECADTVRTLDADVGRLASQVTGLQGYAAGVCLAP